MRGRCWLHYFYSVLNDDKLETPGTNCSNGEWTQFLLNVMGEIGEEKINCYVVSRHAESSKDDSSGEYLSIDAFFIDNAEYELSEGIYGDPFVLPRAVVELENSLNINKIAYCLWKLLCIRSPIRVLICYQNSTDMVKSLVKHLENVIWQGGLLKGDSGDLLVIIGNGNKSGDDCEWKDYFFVFEWRNDSLQIIEDFE